MLRSVTLLLITINVCAGARILGVVESPSYSHQIIFQPIFKELAKRGHELVILTTDPVKDPTLPNLKEIDWSDAYTIMRKGLTELIEKSNNPLAFISSIYKTIHEVTIYQLEHPEVEALIKNETEHFDLVMIEYLFPAMFAFKHRFNCPFIGMTSLDAPMYGHMAVGNQIHQVLYPEALVPFTGDFNFFQRLISFGLTYFFIIYSEFFIMPADNILVQKYFGKDYPDLRELRDSVDMLFTNSNPAFGTVRPITPATITIAGGIHIKDPKPLPKDIQNYLDEAESGVIYFSLGSNVKSVDIQVEIREMILKVFSELPYKVLWKFEAEELPNKPNNVKIQKWIPQQDVLRHPNVKAFITQGGLQSSEEALFSHIPLVVMPFFGDQEFNANKIANKGLGVRLDHKTMSAEEFKNALLEVITNPKYKNTAKELATRIRDEPMNALEKAVWWTEYVIRNKGAQHLKGPGLNLPFYQYYYLDILAFVGFLIVLISFIFYFTIKKIVSGLCNLICKKKVKTQ